MKFNRPRYSAWILAIILLAADGSPVTACPICDTDTGREVRAAIFDQDFLFHGGAILLPFAMVMAAAGLFLGERPRPPSGHLGHRTENDDESARR